jgi:hypothetical protein
MWLGLGVRLIPRFGRRETWGRLTIIDILSPIEKAQAWKPAPEFLSNFRIANWVGALDTKRRIISGEESTAWKEIGDFGGLTRIFENEDFGGERRGNSQCGKNWRNLMKR